MKVFHKQDYLFFLSLYNQLMGKGRKNVKCDQCIVKCIAKSASLSRVAYFYGLPFYARSSASSSWKVQPQQPVKGTSFSRDVNLCRMKKVISKQIWNGQLFFLSWGFHEFVLLKETYTRTFRNIFSSGAMHKALQLWAGGKKVLLHLLQNFFLKA